MAVALSAPRALIICPRHPDDDSSDDAEKKAAPGQGNGGTKQEIRGISNQSRRELSRQMAQLSTPHLPIHLTLTYYDNYPRDKDSLTEEKRRLNDACRDKGLYGFWRLEFQRPRTEDSQLWDIWVRMLESEYAEDMVRWLFTVLLTAQRRQASAVAVNARYGGALLVYDRLSLPYPIPPEPIRAADDWCGRVPHWHLLIYEEESGAVDSFIRWWKKTTNPHEQGCFVTVGDEGQAAWYMGYHQAKSDEQSPPICVGRWWGKLNGPKLKRWMRLDQIADGVDDRDVYWLKRLMRRKSRCRGSLGPQGFTWFLPSIQHARVLRFVSELVRLDRAQRIKRQGFDLLGDPLEDWRVRVHGRAVS